jgi:hypothetical protein
MFSAVRYTVAGPVGVGGTGEPGRDGVDGDVGVVAGAGVDGDVGVDVGAGVVGWHADIHTAEDINIASVMMTSICLPKCDLCLFIFIVPFPSL